MNNSLNNDVLNSVISSVSANCEMISVVIPTYNNAKSVVAAIQSVQAQDCPVAEIIVVDDGSEDNTREVLDVYIKANIIRYIHQNNSGVSSARNTGIKKSIGDWIAFLDADDEWLPGKLKQQISIIKNNDIVWCCGCIKTSIHDKSSDCPKKLHSRIINIFEGYSMGLPFQTGAFLIRKEVILSVGLFKEDVKISEDRDLWWRIGMVHPNIGYVDTPIVYYNNDSEFSLTRSSQDRNDSVIILTDFLKTMHENPRIIPQSAKTYFQKLAFGYFVRARTNLIKVDRNIILELKGAIGITKSQKAFIKLLNITPSIIRKRIVNFFINV